jgi:hypothetical protein
VRNLPAFRTIRKALAALLWVAGAAGWGGAWWASRKVDATPAVEVERGGAPLGPLWDEACPPVVASSRGKRYYWAWCEGAMGLKEANLRHFCGPEEAQRAGLSPAEGCVQGLGESKP